MVVSNVDGAQGCHCGDGTVTVTVEGPDIHVGDRVRINDEFFGQGLGTVTEVNDSYFRVLRDDHADWRGSDTFTWDWISKFTMVRRKKVRG